MMLLWHSLTREFRNKIKVHIKWFDLRILANVLLIIFLLSSPITARAQPVIKRIEPDTISNENSVEIVVIGGGFDERSVVVLDKVGALETFYVSTEMLRAVVPAGLPIRRYKVRVIDGGGNPSGETIELTVTTAVAPTSATFLRPVLVIDSYNVGVPSVAGGAKVNLVVKMHNAGQRMAFNVVVTFTPGDFVPRVTGGVLAIKELDPGENHRFSQPMTAAYSIVGKAFASVAMQVAYSDEDGTAYSDTFNLNIPVTQGKLTTSTPTPTNTPVPVRRPQILITSYQAEGTPLRPGFRFGLSLKATNVGNVLARRVTMILGGGTSSGGSISTGTPEAGGISAGGGDFGVFAPVAASNVQYIGDVDAGTVLDARADLIVNATTNPGAYPLKISFTYTSEDNLVYTDEQVVTLLVYSPPLLEVSFYRDPGPILVGEPAQLPIQVVNLGRKATMLGNMKITAEGAEWSNNSTLVGPLDAGGYFTLDPMMTPEISGTLDLSVIIHYTDDFNQPQVITKTMQVNVEEAPTPEPSLQTTPGSGGMPTVESQPESLMGKVIRFIKGVIGLDSAQPAAPGGEPLPGDQGPKENSPNRPAVPVQSGGKG